MELLPWQENTEPSPPFVSRLLMMHTFLCISCRNQISTKLNWFSFFMFLSMCITPHPAYFLPQSINQLLVKQSVQELPGFLRCRITLGFETQPWSPLVTSATAPVLLDVCRWSTVHLHWLMRAAAPTLPRCHFCPAFLNSPEKWHFFHQGDQFPPPLPSHVTPPHLHLWGYRNFPGVIASSPCAHIQELARSWTSCAIRPPLCQWHWNKVHA